MFKFRKKSKSIEGRLVDCSLKKFKRYVEKQHLNVGVTKSLSIYLSSIYNQLVQTKDALIKEFKDPNSDNYHSKKVIKTVEGIYSKMILLEQKAEYLNDRYSDLVNVDKD